MFKSGEHSSTPSTTTDDQSTTTATSSPLSPTAAITEKLKSLSSNLKSVNPFNTPSAVTKQQVDDDPELASDYHYISNLDDDQVQMNPGNMRLVISEDSSHSGGGGASADQREPEKQPADDDQKPN